MKMAFLYRATILQPDQTGGRGRGYVLYYRDENFPSRVGWKEVVATAGSGVTILNTSVPSKDRSSQLSNYPTDLLNSPPLDLEARMGLRWDEVAGDQQTAVPAGPRVARSGMLKTSGETRSAYRDSKQATVPPVASMVSNPEATESQERPRPESSLQPNKQSTPQNRFTQLMTANQFGIWFLVVAAAIAAGLGAMHALEPGHGKTIVAAYLVGSKGTPYHAFLLGLIVTASHTAGVFALGAVTLSMLPATSFQSNCIHGSERSRDS
jgi:nickel/cobalt exporter